MGGGESGWEEERRGNWRRSGGKIEGELEGKRMSAKERELDGEGEGGR